MSYKLDIKSIDAQYYIDFLIENWDQDQGLLDIHHLKDAVIVELHTGNCLDNKKIIDELSGSKFWDWFLEKITRGEHYYFRIEHSKYIKSPN